ncbi:MAG: helix-turn-helix transcriptional regulator [Lysobacterales bacterium]
MHAGHPTSRPLNRSLFRSELVEIGLFDCPRSHPRFHDSGPIRQHLVVFPRHAVRIRYGPGEEVLASQQVITLYNDGQRYRREVLSDYGDQSIWLRFRKREILEALQACGRTHAAAESLPFAWTHSPCPSATFLLQRQMVCGLASPESNDLLGVTETALRLLHQTVAATSAGRVCTRRMAAQPGTRQRHRRLARRCEVYLTTHYDQPLTLESLAADLATTPFHLSRIFTAHRGHSIHQHLLQLRLRAAVDRMLDRPELPLTDVGIELGFATPSHFSSAFRKHFGISPSQFRV